MSEVERVDGRRLGRRAPSNKPALRLAEILKAVPEHPPAADYLAVVSDFGLYGNDRYGDCGPVSVANSVKVVTRLGNELGEYSVSQEDVFDLYRRSGNPDFDPNDPGGPGDGGVDMQTMLEALLAGGIGGRKPVAFAKVDISNVDEVRAAIAYFGCVLFGVNLERAQQEQTDSTRVWDYSPSAEWGGHAIAAGTYSSSSSGVDVSVVTWAEIVGCTDAFLERQLEEAWVVVWPEHLSHPAFLAGVDVDTLAAAYEALTGRPLPAPNPQPTPSPVPGAAPFPGARPEVAARVVALATRHHMTPSDYLNWLLGRLYHIADSGDAINLVELLAASSS
jgi:hypothetical protein